MRILLIICVVVMSSGCAAIPKQDSVDGLAAQLKPGQLHDLAYYVAQRIEYRRNQPYWLEADTCIRQGYGNCKCKAAVSCAIISQWPGYGAWLWFPRPRHVVCRFVDFATGDIGWIDDDVFWE